MTDAEFVARVGASPGGAVCARSSSGLLAAVSGGPDSTALLLALAELVPRARLVAAHCNFGLRGAESDAEQAFVEGLCRRLGVRCEVRRFDVEAYRHGRPRPTSVEMACRELRYAWFDELLDRLGLSHVAVAHNRQDRVETFFLNLMRSGGESGLRGPLRLNGRVVRPLLDIDRADILAFLRGRGVEACTDSSNLQPVYARNRLRLNVLPSLRDAFPEADARVAATMDHLAETEQLLAGYMRQKAALYVAADGTVDVAALAVAEPLPQAVLYRLLKDEGYHRSVTDAMLACVSGGARLFGGRLLDRGLLLPRGRESAMPQCRTVDIPGLFDPELLIDLLPRDAFAPSRGDTAAWFDADAILAGSPRFELRPWQAGDRFRPFGMRGSKLVSDVLTDLRLPRREKCRARVLTRDGAIVWLVGLRASALYPVTAATRSVLRLAPR